VIAVPPAHLLAETVRALWSRKIWASFTILAAAAVGLAAATLVVADSRSINQRSEYLTSKGWGLVLVANSAGDTLDARVCQAVAQVPGVRAVGGVGQTRETEALGLSAGLALTPVTVDAVLIAWPDASFKPETTALSTPGFQRLSGLGSGVLYIEIGDVPVAFTTESITGPGRYALLDGGVLAIGGQLTEVSYCLVDVEAEQVERLSLEIAAIGTPNGVVAVPVLGRQDAAPTPADLTAQHQALRLPLVAAAFLAVLAAIRLLLSRRDRAVYRLIGFGRGDLALMGLFDYAICIAAASVSAFATTIIWAEGQGTPTQTLGQFDFGWLSILSAVVGLGYSLLWALGRNRHQFAPGA
jgi:hypothetical protein